jgi:hypothetical protein
VLTGRAPIGTLLPDRLSALAVDGGDPPQIVWGIYAVCGIFYDASNPAGSGCTSGRAGLWGTYVPTAEQYG